MRDAEVDEARFLAAGDHLDRETERLARLAQELRRVLGHAQRIGADRAHRARAAGRAGARRCAERLQRARLRGAVDALFGGQAGAQAHRLAQRVERVDLAVRRRAPPAGGSCWSRGRPRRAGLGRAMRDANTRWTRRKSGFGRVTTAATFVGVAWRTAIAPAAPMVKKNLPPSAFPQPRARPARVQPARARAGGGRLRAAARAAALPHHRLVEPGRVLRDPRRRPEGADQAGIKESGARRPQPGGGATSWCRRRRARWSASSTGC